jgi:hypothetical protein
MPWTNRCIAWTVCLLPFRGPHPHPVAEHDWMIPKFHDRYVTRLYKFAIGLMPCQISDNKWVLEWFSYGHGVTSKVWELADIVDLL